MSGGLPPLCVAGLDYLLVLGSLFQEYAPSWGLIIHTTHNCYMLVCIIAISLVGLI